MSFLFFNNNSTNISLSNFLFLPSGTGSFRPIHTRLAPSSRPTLSKASPAASSSAAASQLSSMCCFFNVSIFQVLCFIDILLNAKFYDPLMKFLVYPFSHSLSSSSTYICFFKLQTTHVWISCCVLHVWSGKSGWYPDPILWILSGVHMWKELWLAEIYTEETDIFFFLRPLWQYYQDRSERPQEMSNMLLRLPVAPLSSLPCCPQ